MSIQVYNCGEDGDFEVFKQGVSSSVSSTETCPSCGDASPNVFRSGGRMNIVRTWNDRASDEQKNALTMVTASQEEQERTGRERGIHFAPKNKENLYKVALGVNKQTN